MIKCFLSHSSSDKLSYVKYVANKIRKEVKVFDEETFEKGMSPIEEIVKGLDVSSLFVIFISNSALESRWVQDELASAKQRLDSNQISRIYPIIIEENVRFDDPRIPEWMRSELNIQPILKPAVAARKINARLVEMSWQFHPRLKERKEIFVGRNELIQSVEQRLDNFDLPPPVAIIASGLSSIGRRTLLQESLKKANIIRDSYDFPLISLSPFDGIEDFILKALDLEMVEVNNSSSRLNGYFQDKIELAAEIFIKISKEGERLLIEDRGVLIQSNGEVVDWFATIISSKEFNSHLTFCIASKFRAKPSLNRINPLFFSLAVKEMDDYERKGLLSRYSRFHDLRLKPDDYQFFLDILTGYPEQVLFAVDLIKENGVFEAKKHSHTIQQYGSDKSKVVLEAFKDKPKELEFIYFLCKFEFLSYEVLFDIVEEPWIHRITAALWTAR